MIKQLINMPMLNLNKIEYVETTIWIHASIKSNRSRCPICGKYSKKIHDHYIRRISDIPVFQNKTIILLRTRKFKCGNHRCNRKVFSEQTPTILKYSTVQSHFSMNRKISPTGLKILIFPCLFFPMWCTKLKSMCSRHFPP